MQSNFTNEKKLDIFLFAHNILNAIKLVRKGYWVFKFNLQKSYQIVVGTISFVSSTDLVKRDQSLYLHSFFVMINGKPKEHSSSSKAPYRMIVYISSKAPDRMIVYLHYSFLLWARVDSLDSESQNNKCCRYSYCECHPFFGV